MSIIETNNLTKLYKNNRGARNISLCVEKGDVVGFLGPNGSGKTTVMKSILGLVRSEGDIKIFGEDLHENFESIMRRTGALIEAPALYKDLTAYQNMKIRIALYPDASQDKIDGFLSLVGLLQYKNDKVGRFSLGMKQRLGIALALVTSPELIVLDEPVNGLDIEGVVHVREVIKRLNEERGVTFLISSHMASEIEKTCNKTAVMYEGELVSCITTEEALKLHPTLEDYFLSVVRDKRGDVLL